MKRLSNLRPFLRQYRLKFALVAFFSVGATAGSLAVPWMVRELVRVIETGDGGFGTIVWIETPHRESRGAEFRGALFIEHAVASLVENNYCKRHVRFQLLLRVGLLAASSSEVDPEGYSIRGPRNPMRPSRSDSPIS